MLKKLLSLILAAGCLFGTQLQQKYTVDDTTVYSTDISSSCQRKFIVAKIPRNQRTFQQPSHEVVRIFNQFGCEMKEVDFAHVNFHLEPRGTCLQRELKKHFLQRYQTLQIEKIHVRKDRYFDCDKPYRILQMPQKQKGTLRLSQNDRRFFFRYSVVGKIKRLTATRDIGKGETLSAQNTRFVMQPFEDVHKEYVTKREGLVTRHRVQKGDILTGFQTKPKPAVQSGSMVSCRYKRDNVVIEFEAKALSGGVAGDIIEVQKDRQRFRARITGKNKVEIL
ncbi:MAG: flagellar basal body P-ring formation chaperone FlgA [Campylobacterota bacterium]